MRVVGRRNWVGVEWGLDGRAFEGYYYISRRYLLTRGFKTNFIPGFCPYKFLYDCLDLHLEDGHRIPNVGWLYWLHNPLFPVIWYRVCIPERHPELVVEEVAAAIHAKQ